MPDYKSNFILAIDQGTTSSRVVIYNEELKTIALCQKELPQVYPDKGWVEHDAEVIFSDVVTLIKQCIAKAANFLNLSEDKLANRILAIGITNQRETTVLWDKTTGKPVHNAIVWQDRRTTDFCLNLKQNNLEQLIIEKTGLLVDPYFSASKINWLLNKYELSNNGNILFGTIDSYLIWRLSGGKSHVTDATNASRTQIYNINSLTWDKELLEIFNIPGNILPEVKNSADDFAKTDKSILGYEIPICGVAGDQQSAAIGQLCTHEHSCKITYGTGCFVLANTGTKPVLSNNKLVTTLAYLINNKPHYALEGSIFVAGAAVQWLRDAVKLIQKAEDTEDIAKNLAGTNGVYLIPAFAGLGAPYWDPEARGAIMGLTRDTDLNHIVRAALESVAYQTRDLLSAFEQDYSLPKILRVDGGMTANNWFLQFLADITRVKIQKPIDNETTIKGAAILAGIGKGMYQSLTSLPDHHANIYELEQEYNPIMTSRTSHELYKGWQDAVARLLQK